MFSGSMVALVTPMNPDGSIDKPAYEGLVAWHLAEGTDALVVLGTTGESVALTADEREYLVTTALRLADGRCPVIVGAGSNVTAHAVALCQEAASWGADALLVVTPYYNRPTQAGLIAHYQALAQAVSLPIILYNVPSRTGCDLLPETAITLSKIENIVAIKEATGKLDRVTEILTHTHHFSVFSGDDATATEAMLLGARGVISVVANVAPKLMHELCALALKGEIKEARALNQRLSELYAASMVSTNPTPTKWMLEQMGLISSGIRLPLLPLEPAYHEPVRVAMRDLGLST